MKQFEPKKLWRRWEKVATKNLGNRGQCGKTRNEGKHRKTYIFNTKLLTSLQQMTPYQKQLFCDGLKPL